MRLRTALTVLAAAAALALTGCSTGSTPATPRATVTKTETPTPTLSPDDITDAAIDAAWAQQTEDDKDAMCLGITLGGPDWAAQQLADGGGNSAGLDWDRAAELIQAKCADR